MSAEHATELKTHEPPASLVANARVSGMSAYQALVDEANRDHEGYWGRLAREFVSWKKPFTQVLDSSNAPFFKWFADGTLNVSWNCLDRNVERGLGDKVALIFEADDGAVTKVTYSQLLAQVSQFANALRARGVKKGDRVVIYMSMSVEGVAAMQACARIGAIHSVVFGGFSAQSVRDRVQDAGAVMVITADEQLRGGKQLPLKAIVDEAIGLGGCETIKDVIVYKRTGGNVAWDASRDRWMHELTAAAAATCRRRQKNGRQRIPCPCASHRLIPTMNRKPEAMIRADRAQALYRLGISEEVASIIEALTPSQMIKVASGNTLMCRFRFDEEMIWSLLADHGRRKQCDEQRCCE